MSLSKKLLDPSVRFISRQTYRTRLLCRTYSVTGSAAASNPRKSFTPVYTLLPHTIGQLLDGGKAAEIAKLMSERMRRDGSRSNRDIKVRKAFKRETPSADSDGTSQQSLQAVFASPSMVTGMTPGSSVQLTGELIPSSGQGQAWELLVRQVDIVGECDPAKYPMQKKDHSVEFYREKAHLRPRTDSIASMLRLRHSISRGFDEWFDSQGFIRVHTPVITSNDCEGAGETFSIASSVTSLPPSSESTSPSESSRPLPQSDLKSTPDLRPGSSHFFSAPAFLTVSSQLHLEALTSSLPRTYTLQPAFRAEGSQTARHLSEFWMLEAEIAFADNLEAVMNVVESTVRHVIERELDGSSPAEADLAAKGSESTSARGNEKGARKFALPKLDTTSKEVWPRPWLGLREGVSAEARASVSSPGERWKRITYTDAVNLLRAQPRKTFKLRAPVWGQPLASEHERWITEHESCGGGKPVFVTHYPELIKPFYMRVAETDGEVPPVETSEAVAKVEGIDTLPAVLETRRTVECFDLLVPRIGELVGGSLREERLNVLERSMQSRGMLLKDYEWYLDLRRYGTTPHGGFGLGFERLISWIGGWDNIRECIPAPRWKGRLIL